MNRQDKGNGKRGIEWTDYTWNPVGGCRHACTWTMPDGNVARCYAADVAEGVAQSAYTHGFEHHYWNPERLQEPLQLKTPARIFLDSMSDLMGAWVPDEHICAVFDVCRRAEWHSFQLLTKNAPRLAKFAGEIPANVWVGVSMPPTTMLGHALDQQRRGRYMHKALETLALMRPYHATLITLPARPIRWLSLEPLSFDVADMLDGYRHVIDWLVIGAASRGRTYYQPDPAYVDNVLAFADTEPRIPVFFKGNLEWEPRRENYPFQTQLSLFDQEATR